MKANIFIGLILTLLVIGYLVADMSKNVTEAFDPDITEEVYSDGGGSVEAFIGKYNRIDDIEHYVKIDGPCWSACTYFLNLVAPERVCAGDDARFFFHGVYYGQLFDHIETQFYHKMVYPQFVNDLLKKKGFDGTADVDIMSYPLGFIELTKDELHIQECPR
jgi:hypothetical protein